MLGAPGRFVKRLFDIAAAVSGLLAGAPLFACTALAVRLSMGRPVLFRQTRIGRADSRFTVYKFRTMTDAKNANGEPLADAARLTRVGSLIRSTSLDELPQLFNVLSGSMSIVGPRPLLPEYLQLYTPEQARRHHVRPGLTGWSAVNGRNAVTWERQFAADVWYVDHQSLWLDAKIVAMTVVQVLRREGISQEGQATRERFRGVPPRECPSVDEHHLDVQHALANAGAHEVDAGRREYAMSIPQVPHDAARAGRQQPAAERTHAPAADGIDVE
jgi:sugar transferase EpsL